MSIKRVLFVCTGNSCRSVMAQGLMRHLLAQAEIESVIVESAGVFANEGMAPTRETQELLQSVGVDCSGHRARRLTPEMIREADLVFVMEQFQGEEVIQRVPGARSKVHLLKRYGLRLDELVGHVNIPDPIGKPLEVYEDCFADIREAAARVVASLKVERESR